MDTLLLQTKLYIPPPRPKAVSRPRLIKRLDEGLCSGRTPGVTLISAPAGFGKTTLLGEWVTGCNRPVAWLSLDEEDNDPARFLAYLTAALQAVSPEIGAGVLGALQSPQPPPPESILTALLNEIAGLPGNFILVLDDCHVIEAKPVGRALAFLLQHLPPQMHLVMATREDPNLPLARYRGRGQLTELRAADLRFTPEEAAEFLNRVMGLNLSAQNIAALEARTEGWIAGLQLAALSMQSHPDAAAFIQSFTGSHRFVMDYLVEEVLHQQPESIQAFLLKTSILNRLCAPLCNAVLESTASQNTLEYLEQANLFIVPLDDRRNWYRYHHLFADLLRQRLHATAQAGVDVPGLHIRASEWYKANGLELEAFHHAAAAGDIERAECLVESEGMPLHFRGGAAPVLRWLESLPAAVLDARPSLRVLYASVLSITGQNSRVEEQLQAAEAALQGVEPDSKTRNLTGHIAALRATLAAIQYRVEEMIAQSRRALAYLHPDNLAVRTSTTWKLGLAYQFQGNRAAARQAFTEAIAASQASGNVFIDILATTGLGNIQELDNRLHPAAESYRRVLQLVGDPPKPTACEAFLGLARIYYQWNDLDAACRHGQQSLQLARQVEMVDTFVASQVFLARLKLARGEVGAAADILAEAGRSARQHNFVQQIPEIAAARVRVLLRQDNPAEAERLAEMHNLPRSRARVHLARGEPAAALVALEPLYQQAEANAWPDERLKVMALQAVALYAQGEPDRAAARLVDALGLAEPGGFVRIFVDEGPPMAALLKEVLGRGIMPDYTGKLLAAFEGEPGIKGETAGSSPSLLVEPLSRRELEVLKLIARGLSNREIGERLFLAIDTVKGHNRRIFGKLQVQRRTEAVARARELGLL